MLPREVLEELVNGDFSAARRRAALRRVAAWLRRDAGSNRLLSFEAAVAGSDVTASVYLGWRAVPVERIVGSVGRTRDFDRAFLPKRRSLAERWKLVDRMVHDLEELPPVSLYKVGGDYYVVDGHHRLSVARYHGARRVEAEVTEFLPPLSTVSGMGAAPHGRGAPAQGAA